jgi:hypothetical protein
MSNRDECDGCKKNIGMEIEFGGCYWSPDFDPYCTEECYNKHINYIIEATSTKEGFFKYMNFEI